MCVKFQTGGETHGSGGAPKLYIDAGLRGGTVSSIRKMGPCGGKQLNGQGLLNLVDPSESYAKATPI